MSEVTTATEQPEKKTRKKASTKSKKVAPPREDAMAPFMPRIYAQILRPALVEVLGKYQSVINSTASFHKAFMDHTKSQVSIERFKTWLVGCGMTVSRVWVPIIKPLATDDPFAEDDDEDDDFPAIDDRHPNHMNRAPANREFPTLIRPANPANPIPPTSGMTGQVGMMGAPGLGGVLEEVEN